MSNLLIDKRINFDMPIAFIHLLLTIGLESTSQDILTVCFNAARIIVDSYAQTGGSI